MGAEQQEHEERGNSHLAASAVTVMAGGLKAITGTAGMVVQAAVSTKEVTKEIIKGDYQKAGKVAVEESARLGAMTAGFVAGTAACAPAAVAAPVCGIVASYFAAGYGADAGMALAGSLFGEENPIEITPETARVMAEAGRFASQKEVSNINPQMQAVAELGMLAGDLEQKVMERAYVIGRDNGMDDIAWRALSPQERSLKAMQLLEEKGASGDRAAANQYQQVLAAFVGEAEAYAASSPDHDVATALKFERTFQQGEQQQDPALKDALIASAQRKQNERFDGTFKMANAARDNADGYLRHQVRIEAMKDPRSFMMARLSEADRQAAEKEGAALHSNTEGAGLDEVGGPTEMALASRAPERIYTPDGPG